MAPVKSMSGVQLLVQIGDGEASESFAHDCLINTDRGIAFASDTNRHIEPDCLNPEDPAWSSINKDGLSATITGAGTLHTLSVADWDAWFNGNDAKNIRVKLNGVSLANGGGHWAGAFKLTGWEVTGARNEKANASVTLESDGVVAWVPASA